MIYNKFKRNNNKNKLALKFNNKLINKIKKKMKKIKIIYGK